MKVRLAAAFAVLLFASVLRADTLIVGYNPVTIPDGSNNSRASWRSLTPSTASPTSYVGYTFADGTGFGGGSDRVRLLGDAGFLNSPN